MERFIKKISEKITIFNAKQIIKMLKLIVVDTFINIVLIIIIVPILIFGSITLFLLHTGQFFTRLKENIIS